MRAVHRLLVAAMLVVVAGCATDQAADPADLDGLLVLAGDTTSAHLSAWVDGATKDAGRAVETPDGAAWIAVGRANVLVAALGDGSLRLSDPAGDAGGGLDWRAVKARGADGDIAAGPFYFPTWDPDGGRFAALAGDLDTDPRLTLIDPSTDAAFEIRLGRPAAAAPPAWIGPDRLAILTGTAEAPTSILVDTTNGDIVDGPAGARLLAASADGKIVAMTDAADRVTVRTTEAWLSGDGSSIGSVDEPNGAIAATSLALDVTGGRLAIAWLTDGRTIDVAIHARAKDWRRVGVPTIGKAAGAVLAWFR
jgi:hypothetical protein